MFKIEVRSAWRNLVRDWIYSFINIGGLAGGIAICMLILVYVIHESSYDRFHKNADRIYSMHTSVLFGNDTVQLSTMSYVTGPMVKNADPEVDEFLRTMLPYKSVPIENPDSPETKFSEKGFLFADSNFFHLFSFALINGKAGQVLQKPFTVVLTKKTAAKYFGNANPVGKLLKYNNVYSFEVTGVAEDPPTNSSIDFDFVGSMSSLPAMKEEKGILQAQELGSGAFKTYLLLNKVSSVNSVQNSIQKIDAENEKERSYANKYYLDPLTGTHLGLNFGDTSNVKYLKVFPVIAGLILLLALINYMSLATARATNRAKEIGVRKVLGAGRSGIASQFYTESSLTTLLAFLLGFFLFYLVQPHFFNLLQLRIDPSFLFNPILLGSFTCLLLITILVAGSYPAIVLSAYNPIATLYGRLSKQRGGAVIRRFLTVLQFTFSIGLVISSFIMERQLYFFRHADTGVNRENIVMIPFGKSIGKHFQAFRKDVSELSAVSQVATAHYPMYKGYDMFFVKGKDNKQDLTLPVFTVDDQFIQLLNLQWKIPPAYNQLILQPDRVVINEAAITKLNLPEDPTDQLIDMGDKKYRVAAVLKNFNYQSLQDKIGALCLFISTDTLSAWGTEVNGCLFVKIKPHVNTPSVIDAIKAAYGKYDREEPFAYDFMEDAFNAQYKAEDRLTDMLGFFTGLTLIIACLGLFGLATFSAVQRTKEIGIRKVLGASVIGITKLLAKDFIILVLLSFVIATPVAWWLMNAWLESFAFRITISWWMFAMAGLLAIFLALFTVSFQSIKAAIANPVKSLKTD
jgi:putative ABC transport system permease protein